MRQKITLVIFFLLCQFCVSAQNWQSAGTGLTSTADFLYTDTSADRLLCRSSLGNYDCFLQYTDTGNTWSLLGSIPSGAPTKIINYRGHYYGININPGGMAELVGSTWLPFVTVHGPPMGFLQNDTDLYVYGMFDSIAGIAANKIARYDGYSWHSINNASFGGGAIMTAQLFQGNLFIGGNFYSTPASTYKLAECNWSQWQNLGNYFTGGFDFVTCLAVYNGELYVGGYFSGGCPGNYIARWNGTTWTQVGGGLDGEVFCMKVFNGDLWVGGSFSTAGGISCPSIAKYNGTDWCNVGNFDNTVTSFEIYNGELYAGGGFWSIDGDSSMSYVAKWIGGSNTNACGHLNTGIEEQKQNFSVNVFPNPITTNATFQFTDLNGNKTLIIYDQLGKEIWRKETAENQIEFSADGISAGLYFYRIEQDGMAKAKGKFIIQ